jgi:hypothetical protein
MEQEQLSADLGTPQVTVTLKIVPPQGVLEKLNQENILSYASGVAEK